MIASTPSDMPMVCTLDGQDLAGRLRRIASLAERYLESERQEGVTLQLRYASGAARELKDIVAQEQKCCSFLSFDLVEAPSGVELTITAPPEAGTSASILYEHFRGVVPFRPAESCGGSGCGCTA